MLACSVFYLLEYLLAHAQVLYVRSSHTIHLP